MRLKPRKSGAGTASSETEKTILRAERDCKARLPVNRKHHAAGAPEREPHTLSISRVNRGTAHAKARPDAAHSVLKPKRRG